MNVFTPTRVLADFPRAIERKYGAGQIIIYHGDKPAHVMFVKRGAVKFFDTDADGNEKILHISSQGGVFPLFYSFEGKESVTGFYETISKTELLLVPLDEFYDKLRSSSEYCIEVLQWYAAEMDHMVGRLKSLEKSTAKQKILQALYYLSEQHSTQASTKSVWSRIAFPLTQQALANFTGLTRETVSVTLNDPELSKVARKVGSTLEINRAKINEILSN